MKKPELTAASVDAERVVRGFLDALDSFKTIPSPATSTSPAEEEQRPTQLQEGRQQALELVGETIYQPCQRNHEPYRRRL
jgi:hypothetical protein